MIPKIINYCWFGRNKKSKKILRCIESWKKYCPEYKIIEWNEDNFDVNCNVYVKEAYERKKWAFVSDYARIKIIYETGGIYFDTDVELVKGIDHLLKYDGFFAFERTSNHYINTGLGFGAQKGLVILRELLEQYDNISFVNNDDSLDLLPCPDRNSLVFNKYCDFTSDEIQECNDIIFLPCDYMCPVDYTNNRITLTNNTISIHHYAGSWEPVKTRIKKKIYYFLRRIFKR